LERLEMADLLSGPHDAGNAIVAGCSVLFVLVLLIGVLAEKVCPYCAETVQQAAIVCRYCGRDLPAEVPADLEFTLKSTGSVPLAMYVINEPIPTGFRPNTSLLVTFHSKSGPLTVTEDGEWLTMDFPSRPASRCDPPAGLTDALSAAPSESWKSRDLMAVFASEQDVRAIVPRFDLILALGVHGVIVTAPGDDCDFVSRFFAPKMGVPEDPVTGSAHCTLIPYWAARLGKTTLRARQVSKRGGEVRCELKGDRVAIAGRVALYLEGTIEV
jgi:hypothetical protein